MSRTDKYKVISLLAASLIVFSSSVVAPPKIFIEISQIITATIFLVVAAPIVFFYSYAKLIDGLGVISQMMWGGVIRDYLENDADITQEDVPSKPRIFVAYIAYTLRRILQINYSYISFSEYYQRMNPAIEYNE